MLRRQNSRENLRGRSLIAPLDSQQRVAKTLKGHNEGCSPFTIHQTVILHVFSQTAAWELMNETHILLIVHTLLPFMYSIHNF